MFVITNRFIDGLRKDIKSVVMVHRPQDLDSAGSLALLQEEATMDNASYRRNEANSSKRKTYQEPTRTHDFTAIHSPKFSPSPGDDRRPVEGNRPKSGEDKLAALKNYRKSKGLCFKCGEKWGPRHKCPQNVSLHAMEEVWNFLYDEWTELEQYSHEEEEHESGEDILAISVQAMKGTDSNQLRGFWGKQEVYMLVDSGSTHCFISENLAANAPGLRPLQHPAQVRIDNGDVLQCTHELPDQLWAIQGVTFKTSFKIIPLCCYDMILGMDWLAGHSLIEIHWADKWFQFNINGRVVKIHGLQAETVMGSPVALHQLQAMQKQDSILYCVQLQVVRAISQVD